jgi:ABC-type antimicrobial peptide transport system permease subunit
MTAPVAAAGMGLALLLGLVTGLAPALSALRMNIIDALGRR